MDQERRQRMVSINGSTVTMTKGDTMEAVLEILLADGSPYDVQEGDLIHFALKRKYSDKCVLIRKNIDPADMILRLEPEDTKKLRPDWVPYVYDIELTTADGRVDTFIDRGRFIITEEVD